MFGELVQWCLVDEVVKSHGGSMKIERVMAMYINVWLICFYPRLSAKILLVTDNGNLTFYSEVQVVLH